MKKIFLIALTCLFLSGCGSYSSEDAEKDLEKKINNLKGYNLTGKLEITSNDDVYKYDVEASYSSDDNYRVSLTNQTNNHQQIILKNSEGVYVLTPSLNKSFKFQSDWPYNNSQAYLLQTLLSDIQNDSEKEFKKTKNGYKFTTSVNYPNNSDLVKQDIYLDKDLTPTKVKVMDEEGNTLIKMTFDKVDLDKEYDTEYFALEENMQASSTSDETSAVSSTLEDTYPMYIPQNTSLSSVDTIELDDGQRTIMTFAGDSSFMFVQEVSSNPEEMEIVSVSGDLYQLASGMAAISDGMISWVSNGVEYYVVSDDLSEEDLVSVASSVASLPVSK